ncbi:PH domain-containing protein [Kordiimonas sp.]|uniref:PH domain-containing protein n=1 Tax=Kordiimonas sp. TaxID=1970157 RepID=UPI003A8D993D
MTMHEAGLTEEAEISNVQTWQRLAPTAIIYFILKFIVTFMKQGVQNVAVFGGIFVAAGDNRSTVIFYVVAGAVALLIAASILSYLNFRFRINKNAFLIQKGVIQKKRLTLSFDRIQNIAIKEPIYFKPFGLVIMALESAGSAQEEVSLAGVPKSLALDLRKTVLDAPIPAAANPASEEESQESAMPFIHQNNGELARYGLSNNNIWVFAGLAAGAISQIDDSNYLHLFDWISIPGQYISTDNPFMLAALSLAGILAVVSLLLLVSVIGAIVIYHDYQLSHTQGRFLRIKGLFERSETSLSESKIQMLQVSQTWPAKLLNRSHLTLKQISFSGAEQPEMGKKSSKFIIPSLTDDQVSGLVAKLYPDLPWNSVIFQPINKLYLRKLLLVDYGLPAAAIAILLSQLINTWWLWLALAPILILPLMLLHYQKQGFWSDGRFGVVRTGVVGHKYMIFPFHKVQSVEIKRTPGQRRQNLSSVVIKLAGHTVKIPYITAHEAAAWRDHILFKIESDTTPWI